MEKIFARSLLALYLLVLTWLVLFKLHFDISQVFNEYYRNINLIPFAQPSVINGQTNYGEMVLNAVFFVPFGLLLNTTFKKPGFLPKLAVIFFYSVIVELIQYILAIGATDITDVITNTGGGFIGLLLYELCRKIIAEKILDRIIVVLGIVLLVAALAFRFSHMIIR